MSEHNNRIQRYFDYENELNDQTDLESYLDSFIPNQQWNSSHWLDHLDINEFDAFDFRNLKKKSYKRFN